MPNIPIPPAFLFLLAAVAIPFIKGKARDGFILLVPVIGFLQLLGLEHGTHITVSFLDRYDLVLFKVDALRLCFAYVFTIIGFTSSLYAIHVKKAAQHVSAFIYIGSSLGVVFAGDYFTLFVFWEIMAVGSTAIILCKKSRLARETAYRYVLVHIAGGACLMAGIVFQLHETGSIELVRPEADTPGFYLTLIGVCLNAAVPPLSAWLSDAYPEASVTGSVYLTTYTTKTAVFVLALLFAGTEILIYAGAAMALYGVIYATMENDVRRLLAYHIISQVGYMVCGVGIGTTLAVDGASAHAFSHILYKALLFMGAGAVIQATGRRRMTELGGLHKSMKLVMIFYLVAGFSISGVPLWNGFISKSLIISAAAEQHLNGIELALVLASVGTFFSTTLKIPYYVFFGKDRGIKPKKLPTNMLWAMGIVAVLCTLFGVAPGLLYNILPNQSPYHPFTLDHVVGSLQILVGTGIVFAIMAKKLGGHFTYTLDTDAIYRSICKSIFAFSDGPINNANAYMAQATSDVVASATHLFRGSATKTRAVGGTITSWMRRNGVADSIGIGAAFGIVLVILYCLLFLTSSGA